MPKFLTALCLLLLLSACGQTGALYLPDRGKPPAKHKEAPAKIVPTHQPAKTAGDDANPNAADAPAAPVTDGSVAPTPAPDDTPQSTPSP